MILKCYWQRWMNTQASFEVDITTLVYGGEGLGRLPDGRAVFVPYVIPGERVYVQLVEEKRRYARGRLVEVLNSSPDRIRPRCRHFGTCGGCHYQQLPYEAQLKAKADILRDQLARIGGIDEPPVKPAVPSPQPWNYRNTVQFHLTGDGKLGFYKAGTEEVFPIEECHLPEEVINKTWPILHFEPNGDWDRIGVRSGVNDDLQVFLESKNLMAPELSVEDLPLSVVHLSPGGRLVLAGSDSVHFKILDRYFRVSGGAFFQVNTMMAEMMVTHLLENIPLEPTHTVLDLYCGVGLFSAFLAPLVERVVGVEVNPLAGEDFVANLDDFDNVTLYEADAAMVLGELDVLPDVVIIDPPRAGLSRAVRDGIIKLKPSYLVYISCDPATLARDARHLDQEGFKLRQTIPFDLFPQTYHIESISTFEHKSP